MKVQQLIDQLSFIPSNYDVMVKVGDSERDLITKIGSINCVNSKINPPFGFIELETCNAIDWLRAFYNEAIPKDQINKAIEKIEQYICDIETDTVKAQGMAQALDILEHALGEVEDGK